MSKIPEPRILTIDYEDDPKAFGLPEDSATEQNFEDQQMKAFDRKEHQFTKKSKMILGQVQQRQKQEEEEQLESTIAQIADKDPFNISNDDYYAPKTAASRTVGGLPTSSLIQHSIPAQNIHRTFFPTHLKFSNLRHFHRFPLSRRLIRECFSHYALVHTLEKHIKEMQLQRDRQIAVEGTPLRNISKKCTCCETGKLRLSADA
jgi:transcription initiation factor TFIID subunit 1